MGDVSGSFDVAEFCEDYESLVVEAAVCKSGKLYIEHARLEAELEAAYPGDAERARVLAERLKGIEAEIEAATKTFQFQGIPDPEWQGILRAHPPTPAQLAGSPNLGYNPDTFPSAAIAASAIDPPMQPHEVALLRATVRPADFDRLWRAAADANAEVMPDPKSSLASVALRASAPSSTTPLHTASLAETSSANPAAASPPTNTTTPVA